jgi:hypothetical protein
MNDCLEDTIYHSTTDRGLGVIDLLRLAAKAGKGEFERALPMARTLWPDGLAHVLDAVRNFVAVRHQHAGELRDEPEPPPGPVAEPAAGPETIGRMD